MNWRIIESHGEEGDMIELFGNGNLLRRKLLVRGDELENNEVID